MRGCIEWLARNPVAANLMMILIVVGGLIAAYAAKVEVFPEVKLDRISIQVPYLGAAPEEVESAVVGRIEEAVYGIEGVRRIVSTAAGGNASVMVDVDLGADPQRVLLEIKNSVDAVTTFPAETERPVIRELIARNQVANVAVFGSSDARTLRTVAERARDELAALSAITLTDIVAAPPYEISIEVSEAALRRHGLTFDHFVDAVRRSSLDMPGGSVRTEGGEVLLRTVGQLHRGRDYENLVLWSREDGNRLLLGDIAAVVDGFAEAEQYTRFDGSPAIMLSVFRTGGQNALEIADAVESYVESARSRLPAGISMEVWQNEAVVLEDRLALMLDNGVLGLLLVFVVLALFMHLRLAFWVAAGIPVSFLGAMAMIPWLGLSINAISVFAFLLVLGIVVDDAVVVGENVCRHQEQHGEGLNGAIAGAQELAKPVIFAVFTTVAAFLPLAFVPGIAGRALSVIPLIVIPCLIFSLVESLGILPSHLSHFTPRGAGGVWERFQQRLSGLFEWFVRAVYRPLLEIALRWRYATAAAGASTLMLTGGMILGGWASFRFMPNIEAAFITAAVRMPQGSTVDSTSAAVERLEASAAQLGERLERETGLDYIRHVVATVGDQPTVARAGGPIGPLQNIASPSVGEVTIKLAPAASRSYTSEQIGAMWRDATAAVPGAVALTFDTSLIALGNQVDVQLTGPDLHALRDATGALKQRLAGYPGLHEIEDSFQSGKQELQIRINPAAERLGLTLHDLGRQVRQAFYGEEAQRIQRGRDDIRVMVRYPREERRSLAALENMRVRTPDGVQVPFSWAAQVEMGRGFSSIRRIDRNRAVNVTAAVDPAVASSGVVIEDLRTRLIPEVLRDYPGVSYTFQGLQADQEEALTELLIGFALSVLAIYGLLAVPLRSYVQPGIILTAVPFGLVGAVWGHVAMGIELTLMSLLGIVALSGVVVNDSLIMVDVINRTRNGGRAAAGNSEDPPNRRWFDSVYLRIVIREAGGKRFRPIVLTSLTTFLGLTPVMMERDIQAMFFVPMAVSLAFGVLFATAITLILVPVSYLILDDIQRLGRRLLAGSRTEDDAASGHTAAANRNLN